MKLIKVVIEGFKSIYNPEELLIDEKSTILIGANDHGKTNLLEAIRRLNDDTPITSEDINWDFPEDASPRIEWYFSLDENELDEIRKIADFSPPAKKQPPPKIEPSPEGEETQNSEDRQEENDAESNKTDASSTEKSISSEETNAPPDKESLVFIPTLPENSNGEIVFVREGVNSPVKVLSVPINFPVSQENAILQLRPRVELFKTPLNSTLPDRVNSSELSSDEFEFMRGIFHLAGLWEYRSIIFNENAKTSKILSEASETLTLALNDEWNQGKDLGWKLSHAGNNGDHIKIEIIDEAIHSRYSAPSHRSLGFRSYFVLSMMILARTSQSSANSFVFLFDEPGTYLHPRAQLDMQRSFETICESTQIVYSTHAIFLINKNYPNRNRVISKTRNGTKIDQKPFVNNWKSVRDSLGILLGNNFLIAEKTLLVEGPSDIIYMLDIINRLKREGKVDIDINDLSIVDAGDSKNYLAMAKLMLSEGRKVVTLADGDKAGDGLVKKLQKLCEKELAEKSLQIHKLPKNKSIENLCIKVELIKEAITILAEEHVKKGIRVFAEGKDDVSKAIKDLKRKPNKTLGLVIDEFTKQLFTPQEKLSKLSLALIYEDISKDKPIQLQEEAESVVIELKEKLGIKGEKTTSREVFESLDVE